MTGIESQAQERGERVQCLARSLTTMPRAALELSVGFDREVPMDGGPVGVVEVLDPATWLLVTGWDSTVVERKISGT